MKGLTATVLALRRIGYSQLAISKKAKVSQMTISRWEKSEPRLTNVAALKRLTKFLEESRAR